MMMLLSSISTTSIPTTSKKGRNKPRQKITKGNRIKWTNEKVDIYLRTIRNNGVCDKGHYKGSYDKLSRLTGFSKQQCMNFWSDTKKMNSNNKIKLWMRMYKSASESSESKMNSFKIEFITLIILIVIYNVINKYYE